MRNRNAKFVSALFASTLAGASVGALAQGATHERAASLGALAAAEVIQHLGARPQASLKGLAQERGLAG